MAIFGLSLSGAEGGCAEALDAAIHAGADKAPVSPRKNALQERDFCLTKSELRANHILIVGICVARSAPRGEERRMKKGFETFCAQAETALPFSM